MVHRNTYRGKNLGTSFTDAQKKAIKDGTFDDIYIGDYWVDGSTTWRVMDIDYFYGVSAISSDKITTHHLIVMPDDILYNATFHTSSSGSVGYGNCSLRTGLMTTAKGYVDNFFGSDALFTPDTKELFNTGFASGKAFPNVSNLVLQPIELMSAYHFINDRHCAASSGGNYTIWGLGNSILVLGDFPAFRYNNKLKSASADYFIQESFWGGTGDPIAATVCVGKNDKSLYIDSVKYTTSTGVRPFIVIKG